MNSSPLPSRHAATPPPWEIRGYQTGLTVPIGNTYAVITDKHGIVHAYVGAGNAGTGGDRGEHNAAAIVEAVNGYAAALASLRRLLNAGTYGRELLEARKEAYRLLGVKLPETMHAPAAPRKDVPTPADLENLAALHGVRVQPSPRAGCFDLYWPGGSHAFAVSIRDAIETIERGANR